MRYNVTDFRKKIFGRLPKFRKGTKLLDVGCGDGGDAIQFQKLGVDVHGLDIYTHHAIKSILGEKFTQGSILDLPYSNNSFDAIFLHDVLHHIDETNQSKKVHIAALKELRRVVRKNGTVVILEANRYNPLFYVHLVLLGGHNHFKQSYFRSLTSEIFPEAKYSFFEAHVYPSFSVPFFKIYENIMESVPVLKPFIAYNLMIATLSQTIS